MAERAQLWDRQGVDSETGSARERRAVRFAMPLAIAAGTVALWQRFHIAPDAMAGNKLGFALQSDLIRYFHPMAQYTAQRLSAGEIPLWNPHACSGIPLLATMQVAAFHPGSWLLLLLPAHQAIAVLMFAECAVGAWLCALLFREWRCDAFASTAGGLLFVSVCLLGYTFWPPAVSTFMWLPWLMLCIEKLTREFRYRWWAGLVAGVALQILAGFPQLLVYSFELLVPFALFRSWQRRDPERPWRSFAGSGSVMALAVALGAGIAGAQLLPTLELVAESARQEALTPRQVHYLTLLNHQGYADVLQSALDSTPRLLTSALGGADYLGMATLILFVVGIVAEPRVGRTWLLIGMGAVALVLADGYRGWSNALFALYAELPVVGILRTPERMRVITDFCVICLAVIGFDRLGRAEPRAPATRRMQIAAIGAAVGIGAGMWIWRLPAATWHLAAAAGAAVALGRWAHRPALRTPLRALLLVLLAADLLLATGGFGILRALPVERPQRYTGARGVEPIPLESLHRQLEAIGAGRLGLVGYHPVYVGEPSRGAYRVDCYEALLPRQWPDLHRAIVGKANFRNTLVTTDPAAFESFFDVAGVQRVARPDETGRVTYADNADALPRAYLTGRHRVMSRAEAIRHVAKGDVDFRRVVLLEESPGIAGSDFDLLPAALTEYTPERVVVETKAPAPALLVLSDSHYPGWRVRVDGEEREILLANGLYRAVAVGAGVHRVVFEYRPTSFRVGVALSLLSLAALVAVGLSDRLS